MPIDFDDQLHTEVSTLFYNYSRFDFSNIAGNQIDELREEIERDYHGCTEDLIKEIDNED